MVTYFNKNDLRSFGNYLLSKERKENIKSPHNSGTGTTPDKEPVHMEAVWATDIDNWMAQKKDQINI